MKVKYLGQTDKVYAGQTLSQNQEYEIQTTELLKWQSDDLVIQDLSSGTLLIGDAISYQSGSSNAINYLLQIENKPKDPSGREIVRMSATIEGWHYQLLSTEIETAKLNGSSSINDSNSSLSITSQFIYDNQNNLIIDEQNEINAVKTICYVKPTWSYEILGAIFSQSEIPTTDIRLFATGSPGIANVSFATGGINLKHIGLGAQKIADGRASKYMQYYSQIPDANAFKITLLHQAGVKHKFQLSFETFKQL
jgi:hypothetical protein